MAQRTCRSPALVSPQAGPGSRLILFQDLIDPGPVRGDPGEDGRGLCIGQSIGDNALGHPSTQKRAPRVSLWDREGKGEREGEPGKPSPTLIAQTELASPNIHGGV